MVTDLEIVDPGGGAGATLYVTTGYNGSVSAWDLTATGPRQINSARHTRTDVPGTTACLGFVETAQGLAVLTGGGSDGPLVLRDLNADGGLGAQTSLGTVPALAGDLIATITVTLGDGTQMVYGGIAGTSGVGHLRFSATGSLTGSGVTADTATTAAGRVVALAATGIGAQQYLFTASALDVGVTSWAVSSTGALTARATLTPAGGLWVGTPTVLNVVVVAGQPYLVLAAAGSNTLSLIAVASDGSMRVTDHVMDDLNSRFGGATAMAVVVHGGQSYVVAGGGDDGISLYQILPGGTFLALAHLADTAAMGLSDVSAIAAQSTASGIEIFVGSASETGITQLRYDPGPAGQTLLAVSTGSTLTGGNTNDVLVGSVESDRLSGSGGNDIVMDGAGSDTLTGGTGADVFVLTADGVTDTISDFTPGTDTLDLSGWAMLRGASQLTMASTTTGMTIRYGTELLIVNSGTGGPINPASLTETDLLNLTRVQVVNPVITPPPRLVTGTAAPEVLTGDSGNDTLDGTFGSQSRAGVFEPDVLTASPMPSLSTADGDATAEKVTGTSTAPVVGPTVLPVPGGTTILVSMAELQGLPSDSPPASIGRTADGTWLSHGIAADMFAFRSPAHAADPTDTALPTHAQPFVNWWGHDPAADHADHPAAGADLRDGHAAAHLPFDLMFALPDAIDPGDVIL